MVVTSNVKQMQFMANKQVLWIAGGDGLVGKRLVSLVDRAKFKIIILSRKNRNPSIDGIEYIKWDTMNQEIFTEMIPEHIINLAGAGIAEKRWSVSRKREIIESRVLSALTIKKYLSKKNIKLQSYVSASAVGYYGDRNEELLDEFSTPGKGFMAECCELWENSAKELTTNADRLVILRIGIVLSTLGGALPKMLMTKKLGLFNYFGNGNQYYPWIHIDDLCRLFLMALEDQQFKGTYNAVVPELVTNKQMMQKIMQHNELKGILFSVPSLILQIILGEMSKVVLNSDRINQKRLSESKFVFNFDQVGSAVGDLLAKNI